MKLMRPANALAITIAVLTAIPPVARADLSAVVVYGNAKETERGAVADIVKQAMVASSWSVSEATFETAEVNSIAVCLDLDRPWPCIEPTASAKGIQRLVVVHVEHKGKAVLLTGQVLFQSDAVPRSERQDCEPCAKVDDLKRAAEDLAKLLLNQPSTAQRVRPTATAIEVITVPAGASILIDGQQVGVSNATLSISAGSHQVQLQRSGYHPETRSITLAQGETHKLEITLTKKRRWWLIPAIIGGLGAGTLIGGTIYSFTVPPPDTFDQPRYLYSKPAIGIAVAGGAVALGCGVYILYRASKGDQRQSAPTAVLWPGGGAFGWSGSF